MEKYKLKAVCRSCFLIILLVTGCHSPDSRQGEQDKTATGKKTPSGEVTGSRKAAPSREETGSPSWVSYSSKEYQFSLTHPPGWKVEEFTFGGEQKIVNILPEKYLNEVELPITVHTDAGISFVGIYPDGYGTELPMGNSRDMRNDEIDAFNFQVNAEKSEVFLLESGQIWGFFIVPSSLPGSWDEYGFIFAQVRVNDFRMECYDQETGRKIGMRECDPMMGDIIKRFGIVDSAERQKINTIMREFAFN